MDEYTERRKQAQKEIKESRELYEKHIASSRKWSRISTIAIVCAVIFGVISIILSPSCPT